MNKDKIKWELNRCGDDIKCGFHSGIPACCIKYYVTVWKWKSEKEWMIRNAKVSKVEEKIKRNFYYIPCPDCLRIRNVIIVKPCNCRYAYE